MNENNLKRQYDKHLEKTAPDMEKLWGRIEEKIDGEQKRFRPNIYKMPVGGKTDLKNEKVIKKTPAKKKHILGWISAAACFAAAIAGIKLFMGNGAQTNVNYEPDKKGGQILQTDYEALSFDYSDGRIYRDYSPDGDEYFVQQSVLEETEFFIDCTVTDVKLSSFDCSYTLEVRNVICKADRDIKISKEIKITSKTPYILNKGGEYLLPMKESGDGYSIVFENAPQIEFTKNEEIVFHNGWSALSENSAECIFPEGGIDDFYYDRMRIAYTDSINSLIEEWESI